MSNNCVVSGSLTDGQSVALRTPADIETVVSGSPADTDLPSTPLDPLAL